MEQLVGVAAPSCKQHFRDDILQALKVSKEFFLSRNAHVSKLKVDIADILSCAYTMSAKMLLGPFMHDALSYSNIIKYYQILSYSNNLLENNFCCSFSFILMPLIINTMY